MPHGVCASSSSARFAPQRVRTSIGRTFCCRSIRSGSAGDRRFRSLAGEGCMTKAREALERLREGNRRFVANAGNREPRRNELTPPTSPSPSFSDARMRECPPSSCSIRASAISSSSAWRATSWRPRRSAASNSPPSASARGSSWCSGHSQMRRDPGHARGAAAAHGESVAQPALDRRSRAALGRGAAGDRPEERPGCARALCRAGERAHFREPPAPRIGGARAR